jgi:D-3-phosphoglycerate dehydrogenase
MARSVEREGLRRRVLVTDYAWANLDIERKILGEVGADLVVATTGDESQLVELANDADAILTNWKRVPPEAIDVASRCSVISRYGVGVDNIPVKHATELGVIVTNVPDFCLDEVSDHAMALVLACARRIVAFAKSTRAGNWDLTIGSEIPRLRGQTLGLIGFGAIAQTLVPKALGFGLRVLVHTPRLGSAPIAGIEVANDLYDLLRRADYVSVHAPLTAETRGLIAERELRAMKPTAFLINTSRGLLVDERALLRALREQWIAGAALDVLGTEPADSNDVLLRLDNVIVTPHAAFLSKSSVAEVARKAAENAAAVLAGIVPANVVNREVLQSEQLRLTASQF